MGHYSIDCLKPISAPASVSQPTELVSERDQAVADSLAKLGSIVPKARQTAMVAGQLTTKEWQTYRCTPASIWKFRNKTPASGISCSFNGKTYCCPDTMMADTGADIMLVTEELCTIMGLTIKPTSLQTHTSVAGVGGLLGEVAENFELVLALGTKCEHRLKVGPGTLIPIVGVAESNPIYQVLLCQTFHKVVVGMVHPLMGRFTFMPRLFHHNDNSLIGTLEGMPGPGKLEEMRANMTHHVRFANVTHNVRREPAVTPREWQMSAATALAALALFKGVSRSIVRKWCLLQPEGARCSLDTIFDLVLELSSIHI